MSKFKVFGAYTKEESQRERDHRILARRAAADGMVLLKNDGVLPLENKSIALYGVGARMTVKGGSGSGDVEERYSVSIEQGLLNGGYSIVHPLWLNRFDAKFKADTESWRQSVEEKIKGYGPTRTMEMFDIIHASPLAYPAANPVFEDELTEETDTAIYVVARQVGEGGDRRAQKGDYLLSDVEVESIKLLASAYKNFLLVINCGSTMDLSVLDECNIGAVLYYSQGGMEGGNAFADIVSGIVTPSAKLTDTWALQYSDYPSADTYSYLNGDLSYNNYYEGIYVGYRWFDATKKRVRYPFGFGLSYTDFSYAVEKVEAVQTAIYAPFAGGYEAAILKLGFVDVAGVTPSAEVTSFMATAFYLFDIILATAYIVLLPFMDVEKKLPEINAELLERKKAATLARGEEWIDPAELESREAEENARIHEENRIADLKEHCAKKGLDFDVENAKYLAKQAKKQKVKK